ncbi:MAG: MarR family winged helix-turn-helix transcriptional regulator [Methanobrevibacter sp.]|uniref:MarR family winged helix-turn-helix transcriptional regulator n=1 Tax=Methanobrevibacter sp. TaxID=66852 RepID=UPI003F0B1611
MNLPDQFKKENFENILIYHYVEELVGDFREYIKENYLDEEITISDLPFLLRIRFKDNSTQKDLVKLFRVSNGYVSKILRKFEDLGFITRKEDPNNRRRKIVKLTPKGIEKTDEILTYIIKWEKEHNMDKNELKTLKQLLFKFLKS